MQTPAPKMDSRVKHGNDRKWRGVMPPRVLILHRVIRHPSMKKVKGKKSKVKKKIKKSSAFFDGASLASK